MWVCWKYKPNNKFKKWIKVGEINLQKNCFGDELYDFMEDNDIITSIDDFTVEGNNKVVAVVGKTKAAGSYWWRFYDNYVPDVF